MIHVYQRDKFVISLNYNIELFKTEPTKFYPKWDEKSMIVSNIKYTYPCLDEITQELREMTREEKILQLDMKELLQDGEYINENEIVTVSPLENAISQEWDKKNHVWINTTTDLETARAQYDEYKPLDTPLAFLELEEQELKEEYIEMMRELQSLIIQLEEAKEVRVIIPKPSEKLKNFKDIFII